MHSKDDSFIHLHRSIKVGSLTFPAVLFIVFALIVGFFLYQNTKDLKQNGSVTPENQEVLAKNCLEKTICKGNAPCMTNPASTFCVCMGGSSEIVTNEDGSQSGLCTIDGNMFDEWEYYKKFIPKED